MSDGLDDNDIPNINILEEEAISEEEDNYNKYYKSLDDEEKERLERYKKFKKHKPSFNKIYEQYSQLIDLHGESYEVIKRMVFYSLIADQLKHKVFYRFSRSQHDIRINLMAILRSGHGKKSITYLIEETTEKMGKLYIEPDSIHAEQLIGTVRIDENKRKKKHNEDDEENDDIIRTEGFLSADYLIIDDALNIITKEKFEDVRKYIRKALDPFDRNNVYKRNVSVQLKDAIQYGPVCTITILSQPPKQMDDIIFRSGFLRRFFWTYVDVPVSERRNLIYDIKLLGEKIEKNKLFDLWISKLNDIIDNVPDKCQIEKFESYTAEKLFRDNIATMFDMAQEIGGSCSEYARDILPVLEHRLLALSIIQCICRKKIEIGVIDVKNAYDDLYKCWKNELSLISNIAETTYNLGSNIKNDEKKIYNDVPDNEFNLLKFKENIRKKYSINESTCNKIIKKLKGLGLIYVGPSKKKGGGGKEWIIMKK